MKKETKAPEHESKTTDYHKVQLHSFGHEKKAEEKHLSHYEMLHKDAKKHEDQKHLTYSQQHHGTFVHTPAHHEEHVAQPKHSELHHPPHFDHQRYLTSGHHHDEYHDSHYHHDDHHDTHYDA